MPVYTCTFPLLSTSRLGFTGNPGLSQPALLSAPQPV
jgi:hypothetical protein